MKRAMTLGERGAEVERMNHMYMAKFRVRRQMEEEARRMEEEARERATQEALSEDGFGWLEVIAYGAIVFCLGVVAGNAITMHQWMTAFNLG